MIATIAFTTTITETVWGSHMPCIAAVAGSVLQRLLRISDNQESAGAKMVKAVAIIV